MEQPQNVTAPSPPPAPLTTPVAPAPPVIPPPPAPAVPAPPTNGTEQKKSSPWPWIVGGCILIVLIVIGSLAALGWWGARKVKKEIERYQPTIDKTRENFDRMNEEAGKWQQKSEEFRESMPNPEDLQNQIPIDPNGYPQ